MVDYERAVWQANEALTLLKVPLDSPGEYIAQKTDAGWAVAFGSLTEAKDVFSVAYEVTATGGGGKVSVKRLQPPRRDTGFFASAALAIETALADFGKTQRPYRNAVLSAPAGQLYVYLYPMVTKKGVIPLGGDVRYLVSADGKTIVEKRLLHKTVFDTTMESPGQTVAGVHSHVLTDVPEDTDVRHAILRRLPETIGCGGHVYQVAGDGTITVLGK